MHRGGVKDFGALMRAGAEALQRGDADAARAAFQEVTAADPRNASAWLALAYAHRPTDLSAADAAVERVLGLEPRNLRALILKGDLLNSADARAASAYYRMALNVAPADAPPAMKTELARVAAAVEAQARGFEQHLRASVGQTGAGSRFEQSLDILLGKRQLFLQQPRHYYFPGLPQTQFFDRADFPWLDNVEAATPDIRAEMLAVLQDEGAFTPYVEGERNRPRDLHELVGNPAWSAFYLSKNGAPVEANAARCPRTLAALDAAPICRIPGRSPSILFSLLKPGARIPPHHGFVNTRLICHLPLIVPEGCGFRVGNETRSWREGEAWVFDDTIEHEAWNDSDHTRVILLFEIWRPELSEAERAQVTAMFEAIDAYGAGMSWDD